MKDWEISSEAAGMITAGLLVFANLVPLAGALTLGWDVGSILWLYWMESAVVGALNVIKMALAQGSIVPPVRGSGDGISDADLEKLKEAEQTWGQNRFSPWRICVTMKFKCGDYVDYREKDYIGSTIGLRSELINSATI